MRSEWLIICNPASGRRNGPSVIREFIDHLRTAGIQTIVSETRGPGDAKNLAAEGYRDGFRRFIAAGGDGTVHELLNGVLREDTSGEPLRIAQLPLGTGNDWIRSLGIRGGPEEILALITGDRIIAHDAGVIDFSMDTETLRRFFLTVAGIGFDARVAMRTHTRNRTRSTGRFTYLANIFRCFREYTPPVMRIRDDNHRLEIPVFSMNAAVGPFSGGGMKLSPGARFDDGLLDITIIRPLHLLDVCISFPLLYTGHINRHPKVMTWQSPHLTVTSEPPVAFQVDGEVCGVTPVKLSLIRHAFFAVAPGSGSSQ